MGLSNMKTEKMCIASIVGRDSKNLFSPGKLDTERLGTPEATCADAKCVRHEPTEASSNAN